MHVFEFLSANPAWALLVGTTAATTAYSRLVRPRPPDPAAIEIHGAAVGPLARCGRCGSRDVAILGWVAPNAAIRLGGSSTHVAPVAGDDGWRDAGSSWCSACRHSGTVFYECRRDLHTAYFAGAVCGLERGHAGRCTPLEEGALRRPLTGFSCEGSACGECAALRAQNTPVLSFPRIVGR